MPHTKACSGDLGTLWTERVGAGQVSRQNLLYERMDVREANGTSRRCGEGMSACYNADFAAREKSGRRVRGADRQRVREAWRSMMLRRWRDLRSRERQGSGSCFRFSERQLFEAQSPNPIFLKHIPFLLFLSSFRLTTPSQL